MSLLIIIIVLIVLWLLIEVFSIVLKMTGLELNKARFQIISIITHTGFTTGESELITQHSLRRRIASVLMVISYVSQVTLISLFVSILSKNQGQLIYVGLLLVIVTVFITVITRNKYFNNRFNEIIEKILAKGIIKQNDISIDQILKVSKGYGVYEIILEGNNFICGNSLGSAQLSKLEINVLKVDRGAEVYDFPHADFILKEGDKLVLYGNTDSITKIVVGKV